MRISPRAERRSHAGRRACGALQGVRERAIRYLRSFSVSDGTIAAERAPEEAEDLYATPQELSALFGCQPSEEDCRWAQSLINAHLNRPSLFPCELETAIITIPPDRQETRLPVTPVMRIIEAAGRYTRGRRDRIGYNQILYNYGATLLALQGAVPQWQVIDPSLISMEPATGVLYLPTGTFLWGFGAFKCRYVAGFVEIPFRVKSAMAVIINETHAKGISDRTRYTAGRVSRVYSGDTFVSKQAQILLEPFRVVEYL